MSMHTVKGMASLVVLVAGVAWAALVSAQVAHSADAGVADVWQQLEPFPGVQIELPSTWQELDRAAARETLSSGLKELPVGFKQKYRVYASPRYRGAHVAVVRRSGPSGSLPTQQQMKALSETELLDRNFSIQHSLREGYRAAGCTLEGFSGEPQRLHGIRVLHDIAYVDCDDGGRIVHENVQAPLGSWLAILELLHYEQQKADLEPIFTRVRDSFRVATPSGAASSTTGGARAIYWLASGLMMAAVAVGFLVFSKPRG